MGSRLLPERREYRAAPLNVEALPPTPLPLLSMWLADALAQGVPDANAMTLVTVAADGAPSARIVLLKEITDEGLMFFTNTHSRKGRELKHEGRCALVFFWPAVMRQVRVEGRATPVSDDEADRYFATRPRGSQLAAWASAQSEPLPNREALDQALRDVAARFADRPVSRPPYWGGYAVRPHTVEFWQGQEHRLHERVVYLLSTERLWQRRWLNP